MLPQAWQVCGALCRPTPGCVQDVIMDDGLQHKFRQKTYQFYNPVRQEA